MNTEQKIEAEAMLLYPEINNQHPAAQMNNQIRSQERSAYIAGRSAGLEREKEIMNKYILDVASLQGGISLALDELDETHNGNLCKLLKGLLEIKPNNF